MHGVRLPPSLKLRRTTVAFAEVVSRTTTPKAFVDDGRDGQCERRKAVCTLGSGPHLRLGEEKAKDSAWSSMTASGAAVRCSAHQDVSAERQRSPQRPLTVAPAAVWCSACYAPSASPGLLAPAPRGPESHLVHRRKARGRLAEFDGPRVALGGLNSVADGAMRASHRSACRSSCSKQSLELAHKVLFVSHELFAVKPHLLVKNYVSRKPHSLALGSTYHRENQR